MFCFALASGCSHRPTQDGENIEETDVLSGLDQRPNLLELTPSEFESLISNLFQKMSMVGDRIAPTAANPEPDMRAFPSSGSSVYGHLSRIPAALCLAMAAKSSAVFP